MLKILYNIQNLAFEPIRYIYSETIERIAEQDGITAAECAVYDDISLFLSEKDTVCFLWESDGHCVSCVRCERYADGLLLTCLETAPQDRRKGYATMLIAEILTRLSKQDALPVYVHIHNKNRASFSLHKRLGFHIVSDFAKLVDGTISRSYCTMKYE